MDNEEILAAILAEVMLIRAEQEAFFSSTLTTVLVAAGRNPDDVPDTAIEILNKSREIARTSVLRRARENLS